jgi:pyruvate dehydrogenase E1 component
MVEQQENCFYYITVMNENYVHPALPPGAEAGIVKGMYCLQQNQGAQIDLIGSGAILREVMAGAELLKTDFGITANVWSATSFNELRREGLACERWNLLHPEQAPQIPYVTQLLKETNLPVVAATDYLKSYPDQIREFIPTRYRVLGTDGFGRSDSRAKLREFFEVNRHFVVLAALTSLAEEGRVPRQKITDAIKKYDINPEKPNPATV